MSYLAEKHVEFGQNRRLFGKIRRTGQKWSQLDKLVDYSAIWTNLYLDKLVLFEEVHTWTNLSCLANKIKLIGEITELVVFGETRNWTNDSYWEKFVLCSHRNSLWRPILIPSSLGGGGRFWSPSVFLE